MIFVTVGTHEQPFDRLVRAVDRLIADGVVTESVFIQTGYCTYEPRYCEWSRFVSASEMKGYMEKANVVVAHGGPSSFVEAIAAGKVPVVVPRLARFGEHVNDHQEAFVRLMAKRRGGIIPVYDISDLAGAIDEARRLSTMGVKFRSRNAEFCEKLEHEIERL